MNMESNSQELVVPEAADEETGKKKARSRKKGKSKDDPATEPSAKNGTNPKGKGKSKGKGKATVPQVKEKPKPKPIAPAHEKLKISMVHGDVLILSGGDFIVRGPLYMRNFVVADQSNPAAYVNADRDVHL